MFGLLRCTLFLQMTSCALPSGKKRLTKSRTVFLRLGASRRGRGPSGMEGRGGRGTPSGLAVAGGGGEPSQPPVCLFLELSARRAA